MIRVANGIYCAKCTSFFLYVLGGNIPFLNSHSYDADHPMGVPRYDEKRGGFSSPKNPRAAATTSNGDSDETKKDDEGASPPADGVHNHRWSDQVTRGRAELRVCSKQCVNLYSGCSCFE